MARDYPLPTAMLLGTFRRDVGNAKRPAADSTASAYVGPPDTQILGGWFVLHSTAEAMASQVSGDFA
jgi:hypothetical protein